MKNRQVISLFLWLILTLAAIVLGAWRLPAYADRLPMLLILPVADHYMLWFLHRIRGLRHTRQVWQWLIFTPTALALFFFTSMAFMDPLQWGGVLRTYWLGAAMMLSLLKVLPLISFLILDVVFYIKSYKPINQPLKRNAKLFLSVIITLDLVFALLLTLGTTVWVYDVQVESHELVFNDLPEPFDGYKIVQLSDIHLGRFHSRKALMRTIECINQCGPDMVVFTGDLVNYSAKEAIPFTWFLESLKAKDGVFAVLGNHDFGDYLEWFAPEYKEADIKLMEQLITGAGWTLLRNSNVAIYRGSGRIFVAGIDHWSPHKRFPDRVDFPKAMEGIAPSNFTILLAHDPVFWEKKVLVSDYHPQLTLSGHTHAFQLGMKLGRASYSPASLIKHYWKGIYHKIRSEGVELSLYVNAGLGHISFPARIGMKPEVTCLTLRAKQK